MDEIHERRQSDSAIAKILSLMHSIENNINEQGKLLLELKRDHEIVLSAFPIGGLMEHRMFHEQQLTASKDNHAFMENLKRGLALWGLGPVLLFIAYAIWEYVKIKIKQ